MKTPKIVLAAAAAFLFNGIQAQVTTSNTMSPQELVEEVLVGDGVQVFNVTYNGQSNVPGGQPGIGYFASQNSILPLASGVVLASGNVNGIPSGGTGFGGSGVSGDADLTLLSGQTSMNDVSILEFDFIPIGDTISFNFVFASNEYASYTCTGFNDAFGFFLSGPDIDGPFSNNAKNIALVPNTNVPIAINTINSGSPTGSGTAANCAAADPNWQENSVYFINNPNSTDINFNGLTVSLTAWSEVICGETYHIKLAIGDALDSALDSGVFLEEGSFASTPIVPAVVEGPNFIPGGPGEPGTILRSCYPVQWNFIRMGVIDVAVAADINISGTAVEGVDYDPGFPDSIYFDAGDDMETVEMMIPLIEGGGGLDTLIITIDSPSMCTGIGIINVFTFLIDDPPPLETTGWDQNIQCGEVVELTATITGGFAPYTASWNTGEEGPTIEVSPTELTTYTATFMDTCGTTAEAEFQIGLIELPPMAMALVGTNPMTEGCAEAQINFVRPETIDGDITIDINFYGDAEAGSDFDFPSSIVIPEGSFNVVVPFELINDGMAEGDETVMVVGSYTDDCGRTVDAEVTIQIVDAPAIELWAEDLYVQCDVADSVWIAVTATGGFGNEVFFSWAHDEDLTGAEILVPVTGSATYTVTATDACGSIATASIDMIVDCELEIPNVFTPNNDGVNDTWNIEGIMYVQNTLRVFNRWGQLVYETRNYRNNWRATDVPDGTYFYEIIVDRHEKPYQGHLTVLRNDW